MYLEWVFRHCPSGLRFQAHTLLETVRHRRTLRKRTIFFGSAIFPLATVPSTDRALAADCKRM